MSGLLERLEEKYGEDRGIGLWWSTYVREGQPYWELRPVFSPLRWGFGVSVVREIGNTRDHPHWLSVAVQVGPFSVELMKFWPVKA